MKLVSFAWIFEPRTHFTLTFNYKKFDWVTFLHPKMDNPAADFKDVHFHAMPHQAPMYPPTYPSTHTAPATMMPNHQPMYPPCQVPVSHYPSLGAARQMPQVPPPQYSPTVAYQSQANPSMASTTISPMNRTQTGITIPLQQSTIKRKIVGIIIVVICIIIIRFFYYVLTTARSTYYNNDPNCKCIYLNQCKLVWIKLFLKLFF